MEFVIPVVLAGGTGSRLWPLSRSSSPKQLLNLFNENSLLQETLLRCVHLSLENPLIIYNEEYHFQIIDQIKQVNIKSANYIIEPAARNTAPAVAIAALQVQRLYGDGYLFVMPADHYMEVSLQEFTDKLQLATQLADEYLVSFGVKPSAAECGYGYIEKGLGLFNDRAFTIKSFIEKPNRQKAEAYTKSGNFYWNSGIFFLRASCYLHELKRYAPQVFEICHQSFINSRQHEYVMEIGSQFTQCPSISIDYAVMEHTKSAAVIPLAGTWSDIGSWSTLFDLHTKNNDGSVIKGDVIAESSKNCYIQSTHRLVAAVGLENHIVVETRDSVLIAHKDNSQDIKQVVERLVSENRREASLPFQVMRPWGHFEVLIDTPSYKVKRLSVNIGCSLSLQKHKFRSEHWIIVSGVATIINGDNHLMLYPSQSTYIPKETKHRLSNFSDQPLEIIEVQLGEYLGEDDIERLDDLYGRKSKNKKKGELAIK